MKKILFLALSLFFVTSAANAKVSSQDTNLNAIAPGKALYGLNYSGGPVRIVEVDSTGDIEFDNGAGGVSFSGAVTIDGAATFSADPTFTSATTDKPDVTITNTNADAVGVELKLIKNSASPNDNDVIGEVQAYSDDSAGTSDLFFEMEVQAEDITTASEDVSVSFQTMTGGSLTETLRLEGDDSTFSSAVTDKPDIYVTNTNADAVGVELKFKKDSASPAANDVIFEVQGYSDDSVGTSDLFFEVEVQAEDVTTASEDVSVSFQTIQAGSLTEILRLDTAVTIDGHYKVDGNAITSLTDAESTITAYEGKGVQIESVDFDGGVISAATSLTASGVVDAGKILSEKIVLDTVQTFVDSDATPDVGPYSYFNTNTTTASITDFDGAEIEDGQIIVVNSKGAITFDVTSSGILGGTTDIVTAAGDVTTFYYDGTNWIVIARMDMSDDLN